MSVAAAATLPIGNVQVYWNDVRLGSPRSQAVVRHTKNSVTTRHPDSPLETNHRKFAEVCEVDITVADFKPDQLRYVYDQASSFASASTLLASPYKASTSTVIRFGPEEVKLSGTAAATVDQASFDSGTVNVFKSDFSTEYSSGDFSATPGSGQIQRKSSTAIADGETVLVFYEESVTAELLGVGGRFEDFEAVLRLVHKNDQGKHIQFKFHRAKHMGASDIAIQQEAEFGGVPMTFKILADLSETPGSQLFEVSVEA